MINFGEMDLNDAEKWPNLMEIVRKNVKPQRDIVKDDRCRTLWWQFERPRSEFFGDLCTVNRVLALSRVGNHVSFAFVRSNCVFADSLVVFRFSDYAALCVMQSRPHEFWARFFSSSMKDDLRYASSDCFETFPFPVDDSSCRVAGEEYDAQRALVMKTHAEGLTATYNRFHDPHETSLEILKLRGLHEEMDRAVLDGYGWHDLAQSARCEFLLDYEEDDEAVLTTNSQTLTTRRSRRKKPRRLRWPDDFRDEVLARLLELNEQRHKEELLAGKQLGKEMKTEQAKPKSTRRKKTSGSDTGTNTLLGM